MQNKYLKYGVISILSSYGFLFTGFIAIFALIPLIVGNVISAYGLSKLSQKLVCIHVLVTVGTFLPIIFLVITTVFFNVS